MRTAHSTRPATANFCWCTQFLTVFVATTLQPLVKRLPEFTKDSNAINRILSTTVVPAGTLLISFDAERLYPLIPLTACLDLKRWHMMRRFRQLGEIGASRSTSLAHSQAQTNRHGGRIFQIWAQNLQESRTQ